MEMVVVHPQTLLLRPFSMIGLVNPIFNFYTAMNLNPGAKASVQISLDGGLTYITFTILYAACKFGNSNNGWVTGISLISALI
jgi:hypothetical protein